jgi:protein-L-isoaspartate(D-aspartate) O-methyltransferase
MDAGDLIAVLREHVRDERVLAAIAAVPRELFVSRAQRGKAYENRPLGIGCAQTISQPLVVARMCELLEVARGDRVLDVGTGSGYHAAVLAHLGGHVWSIERHPSLSRAAVDALAAAGLADRVTCLIGDGLQGLPGVAPFDAINVAAAGPCDALATLEDQLAPGGRLVAPVGRDVQHLQLSRHTASGVRRELLEEVRFVPLVGGAPE